MWISLLQKSSYTEQKKWNVNITFLDAKCIFYITAYLDEKAARFTSGG